MADGPNDPPAFSARKAYAWTEIFRCFQVALDPRKLLAAALGILIMSLGWHLLSRTFYHDKPLRSDESRYNQTAMKKELGTKKSDGSDYTDADYAAAAERRHEQDVREWQVLHDSSSPAACLHLLAASRSTWLVTFKS